MPRGYKQPFPGDMRFVGDIEKLNGTVDQSGSPDATFSLWAQDIRFAIEDYRGSENQAANTIMSQVTSMLYAYWRPGLEGSLPGSLRIKHIVDRSVSPPIVDYYDVQNVIRDPTARRFIRMDCIRRDSTGYRTGVTP